jgi:hypothetical protein
VIKLGEAIKDEIVNSYYFFYSSRKVKRKLLAQAMENIKALYM